MKSHWIRDAFRTRSLNPINLWFGSLVIFFCVFSAGNCLAAVPATSLERGRVIYQRFCSYCHGKRLEGQPHWRQRNPDGKLPAPPHDASGHTWHHADEDLFAMTKYGMVPPYAPAGYVSDMPAWDGSLTDNDIWAVLGYIKSLWPKEQRDHQREVTATKRNNR